MTQRKGYHANQRVDSLMISCSKIHLVLFKAELALEGATFRLRQGHGSEYEKEVAMGGEVAPRQLWKYGDDGGVS